MANEKVIKFSQALTSLIELAPEYLSEFPHLQLMAESNLKRIASQIAFVGGGEILNTHTPAKLEPITEFMGEPINAPQPVKEVELTAQELELKLFREKVDRLQGSIFTLTDDSILESYKNEPNVIRGVAKRAGVENYKDVTINGDLLNTIREQLKAQAEQALKQEADANITKSAAPGTADQPQPNNAGTADTVSGAGGTPVK
jgi:hypothetical protein